ncbi:hypothetical protein ACH5RR_037125 [Cinchona calisaya]|uniref:Uncharacterized protein n=1 Tax=Cinchona calisaya TaxID=153742 RepID=A0ABD2Y7I4_9GENT
MKMAKESVAQPKQQWLPKKTPAANSGGSDLVAHEKKAIPTYSQARVVKYGVSGEDIAGVAGNKVDVIGRVNAQMCVHVAHINWHGACIRGGYAPMHT